MDNWTPTIVLYDVELIALTEKSQIKIKDQLSPAEAETGPEYGNHVKKDSVVRPFTIKMTIFQ